jgi:hypothetical protein
MHILSQTPMPSRACEMFVSQVVQVGWPCSSCNVGDDTQIKNLHAASVDLDRFGLHALGHTTSIFAIEESRVMCIPQPACPYELNLTVSGLASSP